MHVDCLFTLLRLHYIHMCSCTNRSVSVEGSVTVVLN